MQISCPKCKATMESGTLPPGAQIECGGCGAVLFVPETPMEPGTLFGDFVIKEVLGKGGMGLVYKAHQNSLDRPAALKVLRSSLAGNKEYVDQFIREARAAARINHPNIVQPYAVGENGGKYFFAMEFVDGESMKSCLQREKKTAPKLAASIIRDIAGALEHAWNTQQLVHHDIKPDNIMLTSSGAAKLADLGLAKVAGAGAVQDDASDDEVLGTPQYISPEQLTGEPTTNKSDIYSLGATFYHLLTGKFPFSGKNIEDMTRKHLEEEVTPPALLDSSIPQELSDIAVKMMAKDPAQRPTGAEVAAMLDAFLSRPETEVQEKKASKISLKAAVPDIAPEIKPPSGGGKPALKLKTSSPIPPQSGMTLSQSPEQTKASKTGKSTGMAVSGERSGRKPAGKYVFIVAVLLILTACGAAFIVLCKFDLLPPGLKESKAAVWVNSLPWLKKMTGNDLPAAQDASKTSSAASEKMAEKAQSEAEDKAAEEAEKAGREAERQRREREERRAREEAARRRENEERTRQLRARRTAAYRRECSSVKEAMYIAFCRAVSGLVKNASGIDFQLAHAQALLPPNPTEDEKRLLKDLTALGAGMKTEFAACRKAADAIKNPVAFLHKPIEVNRELVKLTSMDKNIIRAKSVISSKEFTFDYSTPAVRKLIYSRIERELKLSNLVFYEKIAEGKWGESLGSIAPENDFWKKNLTAVQAAGKRLL